MATRLRDFKRHSRKTRHLIHRLRRSKHASVQHTLVNELSSSVHKHWGRSGRAPQIPVGPAGHWRPLTHRAKRLLTSLRRSKVWSVQKQLIAELIHDMQRAQRRIDRVRKSQAARQARQAAKRTGWAIWRVSWLTGRATARAARATPGAARTMGGRARKVQIRVYRFWSYAARPRQSTRLAWNGMQRKRAERARSAAQAAALRNRSARGQVPGTPPPPSAPRTRKPAGNGTRPAPASSRTRTAQIPAPPGDQLPAARIRPARAAKTPKARAPRAPRAH